MKNVFRSLFTGLGLTALFAAGSLNAAGGITKSINIPFDFKVDKTVMPAGEYRLEQDFGDFRVRIVNVNTGLRVQVLRDHAGRTDEGAKLIFEPTGQGYKLIRVS
jgi:hypothetical protein